MLTINNKTYSCTTPVDDKLVDAIQALPSPFLNLDEDRADIDKELLKILIREIDLALKLKKESGIGFASNQVLEAVDIISKLKESLQGKTKIDYLSYNNTLYNLYNNFYRFLKDGANVLRVKGLTYEGHQYKSDKNAYMVAQGEVGFSNHERIGTSNVWDCVTLIIRNKKTSKTALAHIDTYCGEEQISNVFNYLENGDKEVVLIGTSNSSDNDKRNIKEILNGVLKHTSKGNNVSIQKSYVLAEASVNAVVVDPITFNIRSLIPEIRRSNEFNESLSRMYLYCLSSKKKESSTHPIEIAFDLTKSKKYIPWESYKSTIGATYFNQLNYSSPDKSYHFTYNPIFSIKNNRLIVNEEGLKLDLKKLEDATTSPSRQNRDNAFFASSDLKVIMRLAQAYREAFNGLMEKIEGCIPNSISNKAEIINNVFTKLRTKKIFVDEASKVFNKILLDKIIGKLSELFKNHKESISAKELKKFYEYLDSRECKIPFSTKMGKPKKLKEMMDFIENSKEYKEYSKNAKEPIQSSKNKHTLLDTLQVTIQNDNKDLLKFLLKCGVNINGKNKYGNTPLHLAVISDNVQMVEFLLKSGAKVNEKNRYGNTPLHLTVSSNSTEIIELLLKHKADVNQKDESGKTLLCVAAQAGNIKMIEFLIKEKANADAKKKADVNAKNKDGWAALMLAAWHGLLAIVEKLINAKKKADVNAKDKDGWTALMFAARNGHLAIVEALIEAKADVNAQSGENTVINLAAKNGHIDVVKLLLKHGAKVDEKNQEGNTPLDLAIMSVASKEQSDKKQLDNRIKIIELLVQKGADIDVKNISKKISLNLENSFQVQTRILLLELIVKYKPQDVKEFLLNEHDLVKKLNGREFELSQKLKGIVEEIAKMPQKQCVSTMLDEPDAISQEGFKKRRI